MLSISPLKSASGASAYYFGVANYYENDAQSIRWLGKGADILGLYGQKVEQAQMMAFLEGKLPDGTQLGRIDKDGIHHRLGFDMTVSAPKSFSVLMESGADPRLVKVFDDVVEWFVGEMENEFAQTRQVVDGRIEYVDTQNFTVAAFRQPNSRANEPQTHTHLVVQNMTHCEDGKCRSLASDMDAQKGVLEQIMKHHIYGGLKFRNKLANLTKELGYELVSDGDGFWEIKGVPEQVITRFSTRREEILADMEKEGLTGAKGASLAAKRTRKDKEILDIDKWRQDITKDCLELGFDPQKLVERSLAAKESMFHGLKEKIMGLFYGRETLALNQAKDAVFVALESVSQQAAVFELRELKKEALKYAIASQSSLDESLIDKVIKDKIDAQGLYEAVHPYTGKSMLTTPWQLSLESDALGLIEQGKGAVSPVCSKQSVKAFIEEKEATLGFCLSASQKKAMTAFLTTSDRYMAIQGYAGTGKTTMLRLTREIAELKGYELRGITAGSSAANELRTKGGLNAATFARELGRLEKEHSDLTKIIFVVDEASMLSNPQGHKIIQLIEQKGSQLKIIGDKAQLPSPSSGKLFSLSQDYGIHTVEMTDNLRQKEEWLKEAAIHAGRGEIYDAIEKLTHVETGESYLERVDYMAHFWLKLSPEERQNTLCFAPTHKNRRDITAVLREALKIEGQLTGNIHTQSVLKEKSFTSIKLRRAVFYAKNDVIRFNQSIPRFNIRSGDYVTVGEMDKIHLQKNVLLLTRDNGQTFKFPLSALPKFHENSKDLERPLEIYKKENLELMTGDTVQWKRNFEKAGIRNSELAVIKNLTETAIEISLEGDTSIVLEKNAKELRHLDHGYVLTSYAAQGKDKKRGLGLIESYNRFAATIQNFYVEVTRGIYEMIVVTDDKEHLVKALSYRDHDKGSSLEMVSSETLKNHHERSGKPELSLASLIEKKVSKESEWKELEASVETYRLSRIGGDERKAALTAFAIVNNPKAYRIARDRLGFTHNRYRQDALRIQTAKLFHSLSQEERNHFLHVRRYVALNQQIGRHSQQLKESPTAANKKLLYELSSKRNTCAAFIGQNITNCKPYLTHYSIGELNRIGLPQHEFGREIKKAEERLIKLSHQAAKNEIRANVFRYLRASSEEKGFIATQIKREAKLSHPFILKYAGELNQPPESLWKSINQDARTHSDNLFRQGLSGDGRMAFDKAKTYKNLQREIKEQWAKGLKTPEVRDVKSSELFTLRNELAHQLLSNKAMPDIAGYFRLDIEKLNNQNQQHDFKQNVQAFCENSANFKARLKAVDAIKENIKGHYPFLKESGVDAKILGKYLRVTDRQERLSRLSPNEKNTYTTFLQYKMVSRQAYGAWQSIHQKKSKDFHNAVSLSSKRDFLASKLESSLYLDSVLSFEKGNKEKILAQSATHHLKCTQIKTLNKIADKLTLQYEGIKSSHSKEAIRAFKTNWATLNTGINKIQKESQYQFACKTVPLSLKEIDRINQDLTSYEIPMEPVHVIKPSSFKFKEIVNTANQLDACLINESLMANPQSTYEAIWGEPKSQTSKELRYSGGLIVTLKGKDKGLWFDFSEGVGGAPIQAIMSARKVPFKEALQVAAEMGGFKDKHFSMVDKKEILINKEKRNKIHEASLKNRVISAKSIWDGAVSMKGTLAEAYLTKHRGLAITEHSDLRFWPQGTYWKNCNDKGLLEEKVNKAPALIIAARNEKNEITGVQRIYLDSKTATKNLFMEKAKLSKGVIEGRAFLLQKGMKGSRLYVAEGIETGASIAMADSKASVLVSLGVSNMKNLCPIIKNINPKEVIIAGDNDGNLAKSYESVKTTIELYKANGFNTKAIFPDAISGNNKTDWNDVLLKKGLSEIQKQLVRYDSNLIPPKRIEVHNLPSDVMKNFGGKTRPTHGVKLDVIQGISATLHKGNDLNRLVDSFHKNHQPPIQTNQPVKSNNPSIKINREMDIEL